MDDKLLELKKEIDSCLRIIDVCKRELKKLQCDEHIPVFWYYDTESMYKSNRTLTEIKHPYDITCEICEIKLEAKSWGPRKND